MPFKKYKHFIFDFDGVICDSLAMAIQAYNEIRDSVYRDLPEVNAQQDMTIVYAGSLKTCLDSWIGPDGTKTFFNLHSARMEQYAARLKLFGGIAEILNSLGTKKVSIVTSAYRKAVCEILNQNNAFNFDVLYKIAGREYHQSKTQKIKDILNELSITNTDAVYIGDLESDILYCRDIPIDIISVGYGYHPIEYLRMKNPSYAVASVNELSNLLEQLNSK